MKIKSSITWPLEFRCAHLVNRWCSQIQRENCWLTTGRCALNSSTRKKKEKLRQAWHGHIRSLSPMNASSLTSFIIKASLTVTRLTSRSQWQTSGRIWDHNTMISQIYQKINGERCHTSMSIQRSTKHTLLSQQYNAQSRIYSHKLMARCLKTEQEGKS